jgi:enolase-phosphatase E1
MNAPIRQVLLDIEGTTCPVHFVSETLFLYATSRLLPFLQARDKDKDVQDLVAQIAEAWRHDPDPAARGLFQASPAHASPPVQILPYVQWLIREDRKLTPLKELQGLIWEDGYLQGDLLGPLYPDVAPALQRWRDAGLGLSVYSSGSVKAQQLIYGYSNAGDLRFLFQHWFDTRIGPKTEQDSYKRIIAHLSANPNNVLFISDSVAELKAARASGLAVLYCNRTESGIALQKADPFQTIQTFDGLDPISIISD